MVESSGIGQGDTEIVDISDLSLYVMTPEYGAPIQLEKIDMLDYADFVAINKFTGRGPWMPCATCASRCGAAAACSTSHRTRTCRSFGTMASQFHDAASTSSTSP